MQLQMVPLVPVVPASIIRCLLCNAKLVSVGRFMDQSSLGKPRAVDSEVVIDIVEEDIADIDVAVEPDLEEPEDEVQAAQDEQAQYDANVDAIIDDDTLEDTEEAIDEYGEKEDFAEECLTISKDVAKEPAAICINTEEIGKTYDEMLGYIILQRRELLDDYLSLSFTEMQAKIDEYHIPFAKRPFFAPQALTQKQSFLAHRTRKSTSLGQAMVGELSTRRLGMRRCSRRGSHLQTLRSVLVKTWTYAMSLSRFTR